MHGCADDSARSCASAEEAKAAAEGAIITAGATATLHNSGS